MKTATATQLKLRAHICTTCHPLFAEMIIKDLEEYHPEITEPNQVDALLEWEAYYDIYKDVHGISPRWTSYKDRSASEWRESIKALELEIVA